MEAEFCENLYRLRRNEQYRANFVHNQLNKVTTAAAPPPRYPGPAPPPR